MYEGRGFRVLDLGTGCAIRRARVGGIAVFAALLAGRPSTLLIGFRLQVSGYRV